MYRVKVLSTGEHNNVYRGNRYCLFRKSAIELANLFARSKCAIEVEKLVHNDDVFFWCDDECETKIAERWGDDGVFYRKLYRDELYGDEL